MSDDDFMNRLREDGRQLRYEPADPVLWTRLSARIRDRVRRPTITALLARWIRPVAGSAAALALAASISIATMSLTETSTVVSDPFDIAVAGDVYSVGD